MTRVIVIGECMIERRRDGAEAFAGDAFNVAAHLKDVSPALDVSFATVTGDDAESRRMRQAWARFGIDGSASPVMVGGRIGAYRIETDPAGERHFHYDRAHSTARLWYEQLSKGAERLTGADLVFLTGVGLAILRKEERLAALDFVIGLQPGRLAFDPNVRPALWESRAAMTSVLETAMARADILLPSVEDLVELWGDAPAESLLERCRTLGVGEIALSLGADGCLFCAEGERPHRLTATAIRPLDTAGAGDAFDGAYLAARLDGRTPEDAARAGLDRAARVVVLPGALPLDLFTCR